MIEKPVIFLTKDELKMFEFIGEGERAGSGVDTIKKGWASNKWPKPVIRELYDPEQVELTLYLGSTTTKTTTKEQILHLIEANPSISISEIAEKIGLSKEGIYYHIKQMLGKKLNHNGPTNGGHWEILK